MTLHSQKRTAISTGDTIRAWRRDRRLTVAAAAKLAGLSPTTVRNWETGRTIPDDEWLQFYAEALSSFDLTNVGSPDEAVALLQALLDVRSRELVVSDRYVIIPRDASITDGEWSALITSVTGVSRAILHYPYKRGPRGNKAHPDTT